MWRNKKVVIVAVLGALVLAGSIAGVVYAQTGNTTSGNNTSESPLLAKVARILGIDQQKVEAAFVQARSEVRTEALDNYLKNLVAQGKITQEQADQYKKWLQARPDMTQYGQQLKDWQAVRPGIPPELKAWQDTRPNVPLPGGPGLRGGMMQGGRR